MESAASAPTALVIIDAQQGFKHPTHWGTDRSTPECEARIADVLRAARKYNSSHAEHPILIVHVHHHSSDPESALHPSAVVPGTNISAVEALEEAFPEQDEPILTKEVNSGFIGTDLEERLRKFGARQVIFAGLTSNHCVSTTVRMAANLKVLGEDAGPDGDGIFMLRDATAAYATGGYDANTVHGVNLASLDGEFAKVKMTDEVINTIMC